MFIAPTQLQRDIFHRMLTADKLDNLVRNSTAESLALINMLTKISNTPILLKAHADKEKAKGGQIQGEGNVIKNNVVMDAVQLLPPRAQIEDFSLSGAFSHLLSGTTLIRQTGKLAALANLLRAIYKVGFLLL